MRAPDPLTMPVNRREAFFSGNWPDETIWLDVCPNAAQVLALDDCAV